MIPKFRVHEKILRIDTGSSPTRITHDSIVITKFSSILAFLRIFGQLVINIETSSRFRLNQHVAINRYIGEYAKSVTQMEFHFAEHQTTGYDEYVTSVQEMFQSLPNLRSLTAKVTTYEHLMCIQALPELQTLSLEYPAWIVVDKPRIFFKAVKSFAIKSIAHSGIPVKKNFDYPLTFDRLESFQIASSRIDNIPSDFFLDNTAIKSLTWLGNVDIGDLLNLFKQTQHTHNIEELTIGFDRHMNHTEAIRLMTEFDSLQNITFIAHARFSEDLDELLDMISQRPDTWHVIDSWTSIRRTSLYKSTRYCVMVARRPNVDGEENTVPYEISFDRTVTLD